MAMNGLLRFIDSLYPADSGFRVVIALPEPKKFHWWRAPEPYVVVDVVYWGVVSLHKSDGSGRSDDSVAPFIRFGGRLEDASTLDGFIGILSPGEKAQQFQPQIEEYVERLAEKKAEMHRLNKTYFN
jgi:hypothetical protein